MPGNPFVIYDGDNVIRLQGTMTGGGSQTLVDLGVVSTVSLLNGPQTLATPAAGSAFWILPSPTGFVIGDAPFDVAPASRIAASGLAITGPVLQVIGPGSVTFYTGSFNVPSGSFQLLGIMDGTALKAVLQTTLNSYSVLSLPPAWQANHAYSATLALILGPDNHIWSETTGGTSGGMIPDFAGNEGGTVVDGGVTWTDEGAKPTVGSVHLYGITAASP